jgi:hypothetical protein
LLAGKQAVNNTQDNIGTIKTCLFILDTPFRFIAVRSIRKLARSVAQGTYRTYSATMPLPKKIFQWAANRYWTNYGKRFGITKEQMQTPEIES